jgi:hypothetical protein
MWVVRACLQDMDHVQLELNTNAKIDIRAKDRRQKKDRNPLQRTGI